MSDPVTPSPQEMLNTLRWENIATRDWYREADEDLRTQLKYQWLGAVAPIMYPGYGADPDTTDGVNQFVEAMDLGPKVENEDAIIRPETLRFGGHTQVMENPEFARKSLEEQQELKRIWFLKASQDDPEFKDMDPEERQAYFERFMVSMPAFESDLMGRLYDTQAFDEVPEGSFLDRIYSDPEGFDADLTKFSQNFVQSGITGAASLVLGPLRWLTGENTGMAAVLRDAKKHREWINSINQSNNFVTGFLPNMGGYLTGLVGGGAYGALEDAIAGTTKLAGGRILAQPGLLQKAGEAAGAKIPRLGYEIAGGATAGAIQGVTDSLMHNEHWTANLAQDATLGVAMEIGGRFLNSVRLASRAAKQLDTSVKDMMKAYNAGTGQVMGAELEAILKANPDMAQYLGFAAATDPNGILLDLVNSPRGVEMKAEVLGLRSEDTGDSIRIMNESGDVLQEFTGSESVRVGKANGWLDTREDLWDSWERQAAKQTPQESLENQPQVEMAVYNTVPEPARQLLVHKMKENGVHVGIDYEVDPRGDTNLIDTVYEVIRKHGSKKASNVLASRGIIFDDADEAANRATIQQIKQELEEISPSSPYYIVNRNTGNLVDVGEMPEHYFEHPDVSRPAVANRVFTGSAQDMRDALTNLRKQYTNAKRATTVRAKARNMEVHQYADNQVVEMRVKVPDETGGEEVILHFNGLKAAQDALSTGRRNGVEGLAGHIFANDPKLRKTFDEWVKSTKRTNPEAYNQEFLPYAMAQEMARQEGYYLGVLNGRYMVQDILQDGNISWRQFDTIQDTIRWLNENDPRAQVPDAAREVSQGAMDEISPEGFPNPFQDLDYQEVRRTRRFGIRDAIPMQVAPTQYAMNRFEQLEIVQELNNRYGFSPNRIYRVLADSQRNLTQFYNNRMDFINNMKKGVKEEESTALWRHMQGLDDLSESKDFQLNEEPWTKADVEAEMVEQFGESRTAELLEISTNLRQYFDELFSLGGMNWGNYVKHYLPHMYKQLQRMNVNTSTRIDPKKFTDIPNTDREAFFELLREVDPRETLLNQDVFDLVETYTRLMGRKLFIRPVMRNLGDEIRYVTKQLKSAGQLDQDYSAVVSYIANLFSSIEGIHSTPDEIFRYATTQSLQGVADAVNARFKTDFQIRGKVDAISELITLTTGAHIAARPYPIMRNLTQSLITGGSMIGNRWWFEGLDAVTADPAAAIRRLEGLGIIDKGTIAIGGGIKDGHGNLLDKAVHGAMGGFKWADAINRAVVYYGTEARFNSALADFKAGGLTKDQFLRRSGARLFGSSNYNQIVRILNKHKDLDIAANAIRDRISNMAVERSQYLYNKFDQPQAYRSGFGRLFGQYMSWPTNFYNLLKERMTSDSLTLGEKAGFALRLSGSLASIGAGMYAAGMNPNGFMPQNMIMITGGPYYQLLNDMLAAMDGDNNAARGVARAITSMIPFVYEGEGVHRAVQAFQDNQPWEALMHIASAPIRTDVYPRRESFMDNAEEVIYKALSTAGQTVTRPIEAARGEL